MGEAIGVVERQLKEARNVGSRRRGRRRLEARKKAIGGKEEGDRRREPAMTKI